MKAYNLLQLEWSCRRGMLELDHIIMPFFKQHFVEINEEQQQAFVKLLDCSDLELFRWLFKGSQPDDSDLQEIIQLIWQKQNIEPK